MSKKDKKIIKKPNVTAKLTFFDWGWADNILFSLKAKASEKYKGLLMIEKLKLFFGISNNEIVTNEKEHIEREMEEIEKMNKLNRSKSKIDWTRDEKGNIVSPFRTRKLK